MIAGALARLDSAVPPDTKIAIVEIGVNDRREHNPQSYIQAGLDKIVDKLRERNVEVVVANYFDVSGGPVARGTYFVPFDVAQMPVTLKIPDDPFHHLNAGDEPDLPSPTRHRPAHRSRPPPHEYHYPYPAG